MSLQQTQLIMPSKSQNGNLLDPRSKHLAIGGHKQEEHNALLESKYAATRTLLRTPGMPSVDLRPDYFHNSSRLFCNKETNLDPRKKGTNEVRRTMTPGNANSTADQGIRSRLHLSALNALF